MYFIIRCDKFEIFYASIWPVPPGIWEPKKAQEALSVEWSQLVQDTDEPLSPKL